MKTKQLLFTLIAIVLLAGCNAVSETNQENQESLEAQEVTENLIDQGTATDGQWINFEGETHENSEMISVGPINYDSDRKYIITSTAYISYYQEDEFLETILYDYKNDFPLEIENIQDSNNIFISFNENKSDVIQLTEE